MTTAKTLISAYGIDALTSQHPGVRKLKRQSADPTLHGNKVWGSSWVLMDYFTSYPIAKKSRVMDIGCGWGLTGAFLAKTYEAQVLASDADAAVAPYLDLHCDINGVEIAFEEKKYQQITVANFTGVHTVVGADICFWEELTQVLFNMIRRALRAGVKQILIADPGRPPFWELAEICHEQLDAEIISHRIRLPKPSTKHIIVIKNSD
ncbi:MAG: methyltransferase domain-containing protein [Pseudomonadales bacterium]